MAGAAPDPLPAALSDEQRAEVEADRYLMLMVLSEAVAVPLPGEDPRRQADEALWLLDRAAQLRDSTPAYHSAAPPASSVSGTRGGAQRERERAASCRPTRSTTCCSAASGFEQDDLAKARSTASAAAPSPVVLGPVPGWPSPS